MILLPPDHAMNNTPHVQNCVYPPFTEAATGETRSESLLPSDIPPAPLAPPNLPPQNTWTLIDEIGDGACGFRAISRQIYDDPEQHAQVRFEVIQYMRQNRSNPHREHAI